MTRIDGANPDADRWIEALLGARMRFHPDRDATRDTYRRWAQLYHRLYDPAHQGEPPYQPPAGPRLVRRWGEREVCSHWRTCHHPQCHEWRKLKGEDT